MLGVMLACCAQRRSRRSGKIVLHAPPPPTNPPIYQPTNLPIYQSTNLPIYQPTNPPSCPPLPPPRSSMEILKERISRDGVNLGNGILKVDSFINHQVDPALMLAVGGALAARFAYLHPNKVFTAEISGIAPALLTALALGVPVLYARKSKPITMHPNAIVEVCAQPHQRQDHGYHRLA
ncbi:MAG: hypothetical protein V9H69_11105 [Anaerolineae bacterium]